MVSVIILNYNWLNYLKEILPYIINLKYEKKEIIIIDNGSVDWSIDFIKSYYNNIKLIESPVKREKNFACNYAVNLSEGEYVLLLDNDIIIEDNEIILKLLNFYEKLIKPWFVTISLLDKGSTDSSYYGWFFNPFFINFNKKINIDKIKFLNWIKIWFPHWANIFFKKEIWNIIWWYDADLKYSWDDTDIWIKSILFWYNNYLYSHSLNIHLWINNYNNIDIFCYKWKNIINWQLTNIFTNYRNINLIQGFILFTIFIFLRSIKQSIQRVNIRPFLAFLQWYYLFFKDLPIAIKKRRKMQENRIIQDDIFLKIKPPK